MGSVQTSNTLTCPLRCVAPSKIVANAAVRKLVHRFKVPANVRSKQPHLPQPCAQSATFIQSSPRLPAGELTDEEDEDMQMSQLCPLNDEILPISASGLRLKQVCSQQKASALCRCQLGDVNHSREREVQTSRQLRAPELWLRCASEHCATVRL